MVKSKASRPKDVDNLVVQLKAGALAVPLKVVQSRVVGPSLGQDSIDKSLTAAIIGLGTVALFMIIYYRLPGFLSVLALIIYTLLVLAIFKLLPVTLTLAGIAGFVLSVGMAVDANILIFSRLKEELRLGRSASQSVELGFAHAWPSIRDSNITSMITAAILYWFGQYTGATIITGFALTLFIGVAVSMFTAYTVTRTFLRLVLSSTHIHNTWWLGTTRPACQCKRGGLEDFHARTSGDLSQVVVHPLDRRDHPRGDFADLQRTRPRHRLHRWHDLGDQVRQNHHH